MDWFGLDDMQKEFKEVSFNLKKIEDISNIIKTDYGFHIIQKLEERIVEPISLESIKPKISIKLKQEKYQKWLTDNTEKIKINNELLKINKVYL